VVRDHVVLTLAGILVIAGAGIVYAVGWGIDKARPGAGRTTMSAARFVFALCVELVDLMNGHKRKQPEPVVVIHTVHTAPEPVRPRPAPPEPPQRPPPPSKAQQIADAKAAYVNADLIDEDDDPALLEQRIGAIVGVRTTERSLDTGNAGRSENDG
jgi:hypothetical protein